MWARAVPYDEFARRRREAPVAWSPGEGPGFWSVTGYADIVTASRDVATFSSSGGVSFEDPTDEDMAARRTIIDTDPPAHTKLRKIVASTFSQRAVAVYEHFITGLTEQVLDRMPASGEPFDFVDAVAKEVPIRVLAQVMGLPANDLDLFIDLGDRLIANTDPGELEYVGGTRGDFPGRQAVAVPRRDRRDRRVLPVAGGPRGDLVTQPREAAVAAILRPGRTRPCRAGGAGRRPSGRRCPCPPGRRRSGAPSRP
jgi:cytochrome P450